MKILAVNLTVRCVDGATYEDITLAVADGKRLYLKADNTELANVQSVLQCTAVVPPMILASALYACREVQQ